MNFKIAFAGTVAMALAALFTTVGCGGDDCQKAADHLVECLNLTVSGSTTSAATPACEGTSLCSAGCTNAADCAAIKDAFSAMPTDASKAFLDCSSKCATAK